MSVETGVSMSRIESGSAFGTDPMSEIRMRVIADIEFEHLPLAFLIADLLAGCTNRQQTAKSLHFRQCFLQFEDQTLSFALGGLAIADVADDQTCSVVAVRIPEYD